MNPREKGRKQNVRVLIVEDEFLVSEMIQGISEELGYTVAGKASDGRQAVEMAKSLRPDVILMDIKMPDMDGIEASRRIQAACPAPIVVLTAFESSDLVRQSSDAGVGAYILKPPKAPELERAVVIAMARFRDLMELRRLNDALKSANRELQEVILQVQTLSGLLPICAGCKKIRDNEGVWHPVDVYIRQHTAADFTHGFCPECVDKIRQQVVESPPPAGNPQPENRS